MERIGVFGGTFDPPHLGHLILAEAAREQLGLERVLWAVAGQSPLKLDRELSPVGLRLEMVRAAIAGHPQFALSEVDVRRPGPHYTVDALGLIASQHPNAELYFIMGEDSLRDLPQWHRPADLIAECRLAVLRRPGVAADLAALEAAIPGLTARVEWIVAPEVGISASDVRRRVCEGRSIRYLVPAAVEAIIVTKGLYRCA